VSKQPNVPRTSHQACGDGGVAVDDEAIGPHSRHLQERTVGINAERGEIRGLNG
jgi:hypothetical protein